MSRGSDSADYDAQLEVGRKIEQPLAATYRIDFDYQLRSVAGDYFSLALVAAAGPLSTRDYRIELEAIPLDGHRAFIHRTYAYAFGMGGRLAMHSYLVTLGRDKLGFTITGQSPQGEPKYVRGPRVIERNTMRYCLAIDAYLAAMDAAPADRFEKRLRLWYDNTEDYAPHLREMDRDEYLALKRAERARQRDLR